MEHFASILRVNTNTTTDTAIMDTSKVDSIDISSSSAAVVVPVLPHQVPVAVCDFIVSTVLQKPNCLQDHRVEEGRNRQP